MVKLHFEESYFLRLQCINLCLQNPNYIITLTNDVQRCLPGTKKAIIFQCRL